MLKSGLMSKLRPVFLAILMIVSLVLAFGAGFWMNDILRSQAEFPLIKEAYPLLETHYIEPLPEELILERGMLRGMLEVLNDPYTQYLEPEAHSIQTDSLTGEYGGIGAMVTSDGTGKYYLNPFTDGPAAEADIRPGARLLAINGAPIGLEYNLDTVTSMLRGPVGTEVWIRIRNPAERTAQDLLLVMKNIPLPSVISYILPGNKGTGVIAISIFSEKTSEEVEAAIESLLDRGSQRFILDLRNNGGGLLDSAVEVSRIFLREGIIVAEERRGEVEQKYLVEEPGKHVRIPLAVITNETTASAAEVVAAALQGNDRAALIGVNTFGKGTVQSIVELTDGSSMRITSSRWLKPDGKPIEAQGLEPDILLDSETAGSEQVLVLAAQWLLDDTDEER